MPGTEPPQCRVTKLSWSDPDLGAIDLPKGPMKLRAGFGSGLSIRASDPPGTVWAAGDRGPNLKIKTARELYGLQIEAPAHGDGAKIMPRLDIGPAIAELNLVDDRVELVRTLRLTGGDGQPISGLPIPEGGHAKCEPALDIEGGSLDPDPSGADTEGIAALADGSFWLGDEYGPSLLKVSPDGAVQKRWVPAGMEQRLRQAGHPVEGVLPALAAKRHLNRGFEAIAMSGDERLLHLAFQSPLAHPDKDAHENARHVRIWSLDAATGAVAAQYLYPLDPPESFRRDCAKGELDWSDLKVSEIALLPDGLLVLERGSETTKIYRVRLDSDRALPPGHLDIATRPTIEELSAAGHLDLPVLAKDLLFSTDDHPQVAADLEGMVILREDELLLVNDNDFGVEGASTSFWRVTFAERVFGG